MLNLLAISPTSRAQDTGYSAARHRQDGPLHCRRRRIGQEHRRQHHAFYGYHSDGRICRPGRYRRYLRSRRHRKGFQNLRPNTVSSASRKKPASMFRSLLVSQRRSRRHVKALLKVETSSSEIGTTSLANKSNSSNSMAEISLSSSRSLPASSIRLVPTKWQVGVYGNVAYSVNGGRTEYNNWELDGGDNMDNGSNSTLNVLPQYRGYCRIQSPHL